ncbi:MAG: hypothetical protein ACPLPT_06200 [Moorellales bacterium]
MRVKWLVVVLAGLVAVLAGRWAYGYYCWYYRVEPEEVLGQALSAALAASAFRYRVQAELVVEGQRRALSEVSGERDREGNFHFQGTMAGDRVEVYQIADTTYLLDSQTGKWMVVPGSELARQRMLMAEIDPLSNLRFASRGPAVYRGRENRQHVLEFRAVPANEFMTTWFEEFTYRVWIDGRTRRLQKVLLEARSRANPQARATFAIQLFDYDLPLRLEPPV